MLRRLRSSSPARAMLCLAVLLAASAAFGLHPEPLDEGRNAAAAFSDGDSVRSGPHLCVACLTHAAALTAPLVAAVHAASVSQTASPRPSPAPAARLDRTPCSGLSPPSAS